MSSTLLLFFLLLQMPVAQQRPQTLESGIRDQVSKWIATGEHQDIPWKVQVLKPQLTFQQRTVVKVKATIDAAVLQTQSVKRDLLFIIKVADANGKWSDDENFVPQKLDSSLGNSTNLEMESEVLLKPGKYRLATIVLDRVLNQYDLSFSTVEVPALKNDPLPRLLDTIPPVEFVRDGVHGAESFSAVRAPVPVVTRAPIALDILVDVSARERQVRLAVPPDFMSPRMGRPIPPRMKLTEDKGYQERLMQSASVLAGIEPTNGCVRMSAFDASTKRILLEPTLAKDVDWVAVRDKVLGPEHDTISVNALQTKRDTPRFVRDNFDRLVNQDACPHVANATKPLRIVAVLSHGLDFPDRSEKVKMESCGCLVIYLRQSDTAYEADDLKGMLAPLSPKVLDFHDPAHFRQKLADFISEIQKAVR